MTDLPTLVIGPESGGRGFRVLARSGDLTLDATAQSRLTELPLAVAEWGGHGEASFAARLPLSPQYSIVLRGRNFGMGSGGHLAYANAVIVPTGAAHAAGLRGGDVMDRLPEPDGSADFASRPLAVTPGGAPVPALVRDWAKLGLDYSHVCLFVPGDYDPGQILASLLAGADVDAWATTLYLRTESIRPAEIFSLLVLPDTQRLPQSWPHEIAVVTPGDVERENTAPPEAWQAWQFLQEMSAASRQWQAALTAATLQTPNFRDDGAVNQLRGILRRTVSKLDFDASLGYLLGLTQASVRGNNGVLTDLAGDLAEFTVSRANVVDAGKYLTAFARHGFLRLPYIRPLYRAPRVLPRLEPFAFRRLLDANFADDLLDDTEAREMLRELQPWQRTDLAAWLTAPETPNAEDYSFLLLDLALLEAQARAGAAPPDLLRPAMRQCLDRVRSAASPAESQHNMLRLLRAGNRYKAAAS